VAEEVEHAVVRVGRVGLDQRVNQPDADRVCHQQERPQRDGVVMQAHYDQTDQRQITLSGVIYEGVMLEW
jgi:hypothetical protein